MTAEDDEEARVVRDEVLTTWIYHIQNQIVGSSIGRHDGLSSLIADVKPNSRKLKIHRLLRRASRCLTDAAKEIAASTVRKPKK